MPSSRNAFPGGSTPRSRPSAHPTAQERASFTFLRVGVGRMVALFPRSDLQKDIGRWQCETRHAYVEAPDGTVWDWPIDDHATAGIGPMTKCRWRISVSATDLAISLKTHR